MADFTKGKNYGTDTKLTFDAEKKNSDIENGSIMQQEIPSYESYFAGLPKEQVENFRRHIAEVTMKEGQVAGEKLGYKYAAALEYAKVFESNVEDAMNSMDSYNQTMWKNPVDDKGALKAIADYWKLGKNTLASSELGNKLYDAELRGSEEEIEAILNEYKTVQAENETLQDGVPRNLLVEAIKNAAQTLPYTAAVAIPSVVGGAVGGPVAAAALGGASGYGITFGNDYIDFRSAGFDKEIAGKLAAASSVAETVIEQAVGNIAEAGAAAAGKKILSKKIVSNVLGRIGGKSAFTKLVKTGAGAVGETVFSAGEEALEEGLQALANRIAYEAGSLMQEEGVEIPSWGDWIKDTAEEMKGAFLGSLILGPSQQLLATGVSKVLKPKDYQDVMEKASTIESKAMFEEAVKDSKIFEGLSEEDRKKAVDSIWESAEARREADIAESMDVSENAEGNPVDETGERVGKAAEFRTEEGELATETATGPDGKNYFLVGDTSRTHSLEADGNRYGYIEYSEDDKTVTINQFKMTSGRENIAKEFYQNFAENFAGKKIVWNPKQETNLNLRNEIINENPRGKKAGLDYFENAEVVSTRKADLKIARQIKAAIPSMTTEQVGASLSLVKAVAKAQGMTTDQLLQTFDKEQIVTNEKTAGVIKGEQQLEGQLILGAHELNKAGKAIIYVARNGDMNTFVHEFAHHTETYLTPEQRNTVMQELGFDSWNRETSEKFADGLIKYMRTGKAQSEGLRAIFEKVAQVIGNAIRGFQDTVQLSKKLMETYEELMKDDGSGLSQAMKIAEEADAKLSKSQKKDAETKADTKTSEEENQEVASQATDEARDEKGLEGTKEDIVENAENVKEAAEALNEKAEKVIQDVNTSTEEKAQAAGDASWADYVESLAGYDLFQTIGIEAALNNAEPNTRKNLEKIIDSAMAEKKNLEKWGKPEEEIEAKLRDKYGIVKSNDTWKFDIDTSNWRIKRPTQLKEIMSNIVFQDQKVTMKLDEILDAPALYNLIPKIKDTEIELVRGSTVLSSLVTPENTIRINLQRIAGVTGPDSIIAVLAQKVEQILQKENGEKTAALAEYMVEGFRGTKSVENLKKQLLENPAYKAELEAKNKFGEGSLFQIIGEKGALELDRVNEVHTLEDNRNIAKEMEEAGKDAKTIRLATGWEKGIDRKWRYETADDIKLDTFGMAQFRRDNPDYRRMDDLEEKWFNDETTAEEEKELNELYDKVERPDVNSFVKKLINSYATLKDVIKNDELLAAYPALGDVKLYFGKIKGDYNTKGMYSPEENAIILFHTNPESLSWSKAKNTISVLTHEIQHWIQSYEGFATGGNENLFETNTISRAKIEAEIDRIRKERNELIFSIPSEEFIQLDKKLTETSMTDEEYKNARYGIYQKYEVGPKIISLSEEIESLQDRISEIDENALDGQVELEDGRLYEDTFAAYRSLSGEVEARNVQKRMRLSAEERLNTLLSDSEDIERSQQIVLYQTLAAEAAVEAAAQERAVREEYENTENWMKAPNGEDTNLTEKQWIQVRTDNFKKWFGDWENDPQNASKVVDENGEPLVVYHGSHQWFTEFNNGKQVQHSKAPANTIFTSKDRDIAMSFADYYGAKQKDVILDKDSPLHERYHWGVYRGGGIYSLFLNMRNPKTIDFNNKQWNDSELNINDETQKAIDEGYDGLIAENIIDVGLTDVIPPATTDYIVFKNTDVKSATDNNGMFDESNPDILFQTVSSEAAAQERAVREELDKEYEKAVTSGNIDKAKEMLLKKATENGYVKQSYFGDGSWAAPTAGVEKNQFTDLEALQQYVDDYGDEVNIYGIINGVQAHQEDYYFNPTRVGFTDQAAVDTSQVYRRLRYDKAGPDTKITVYRAIPNDIHGKKLLAGDWIALSKKYCEDHGENRYGKNNYHVIEQEVPISNIWQGSEDMREFGFDDGNGEIDVEKNVPNNRKLLDITYDKAGNLIPLSERFNQDIPSILFQTAYHGTSANFDKFDTSYMNTGEGSQSFGWGVYVTASENIARDYAERQYLMKYGTEDREARKAAKESALAKELEERKDYETPEAYAAYVEKYKARYAEMEKDGVLTPFQKRMFESSINNMNEEARVKKLEDLDYWINKDKSEIEELQKEIDFANANKDKAKRNLYTVEIPDNKYLVWDKTTPKAQRTRIMSKLYDYLIERDYKGAERELREEIIPVFSSTQDGREIYNNIMSYLGSAKEASEFLFSIGIVGMDYPAGTNYGTDEEARNYVLFDDSLVTITDHTLYQTEKEMFDHASTFDSWEAYKADVEGYREVFGNDDNVNHVPVKASDQWYKDTWEQAKAIAKRNTYDDDFVQDVRGEETEETESLKDQQWYDEISNNEDMLLEFVRALSYNAFAEHKEAPADYEEQQQWENEKRLRDRFFKEIGGALSKAALVARRYGPGEKIELDDKTIKAIKTMLKNNKRDFRDLYADFTGDSEWAIPEGMTTNDKIAVRIGVPVEETYSYTPKEKQAIIDRLDFEDLKKEIKDGSLEMDDDRLFKLMNGYEADIRKLEKKIEALKKQEEEDAVLNVKQTAEIERLYQEKLEKQARQEQLKNIRDIKVRLVKDINKKVDFKTINYDEGRKIIAIQALWEDRLSKYVNDFINQEGAYIRDAYSLYKTDLGYRARLQSLAARDADLGGKGSRNLSKVLKLFETKTFDKWTEEERQFVAQHLPLTDWIKELGLEQLSKERKGALQMELQSEEVQNLLKEALPEEMLSLLSQKEIKNWTLEQMEDLVAVVNNIRKEGREKLQVKNEARLQAAEAIRNRIEAALKDSGIAINADDDDKTKERKQKKIDAFNKKVLGIGNPIKGTLEASKSRQNFLNRLLHGYSDANVRRVARILDNGKEGANTTLLYYRENECYNQEQKMMRQRSQRIERAVKENDIKLSELFEKVTVNFADGAAEFTVDELLYFAAASLDDNSREAVACGNMYDDTVKSQYRGSEELQEQYQNMAYARYDKVLEAAEALPEKFKKLSEAIQKDYGEQYERMNKISIDEFNSPVWRVQHYVPLVRLESNGDTNANRVKQDLLGSMGGTGSNWVDKGMTKKRVEISPANQKPVETGLYSTWADSLKRTEHFIAYASYVRELNRVYMNRDSGKIKQLMQNRYGDGISSYINNYINEVANPDAGAAKTDFDRIIHALRGKTAPAYLSWKMSGIIKQACTSPWPFMAHVNPAEYAGAAFDLARNYKETCDAIKSKSEFMNARRFDPIADLLDEQKAKARNKFAAGLNNFETLGMQGLEWIDWACVAPGWLAVYRKEYARLSSDKEQNALVEERRKQLQKFEDVEGLEWIENQAQRARLSEDEIERRAVLKADDVTRLCQPSNRLTDLAPMFKQRGPGSEVARTILQFTTSLNVIWQNIRYDLPEYARAREFEKVVGTIAGYTLAGIAMGLVTEGLDGDDDDDDENTELRKLLWFSTTQFTDAVPLVGSVLSNYSKWAITGEKPYNYGMSDLFPLLTKTGSGIQNASQDKWGKACLNWAYAAGLGIGLPVSGIKELGAAAGIGDDDGELEFKPEAFIGRR